MPNRPRIAVIGGGLGGTTAAIMLQRAGYACHVFEQAPELARIGAGINLAPNTTRVMRDLGLLDRLLRIGLAPIEKLSRDGVSGEVTFRADTAALGREYGVEFLSIHRSDLQRVLTDALAPGTLHLAKRLENLEVGADGVTLSFADGSREAADIVIGADGVNSRIREILLGSESPIYSGMVAYRSIFPRSRLGGLSVPDNTKWWGDDRYVLVYYIDHAREDVYVICGAPEEWEGSFSPTPADMDRLRGAYRDYHPEVQQVLDAVENVSRWPVLDRDPLPLWTRGPIVLLGDACHPMPPYMGQGAGMAIEDGVMLARCLQEAGGEAEQAFALYVRNRRDRTSRVQAESRQHEWMRYSMDHHWLYGYDVMSVPLIETPSSPNWKPAARQLGLTPESAASSE